MLPQAQLLMRQDAFGGVMDFKLDGAGFGDTVVKCANLSAAASPQCFCRWEGHGGVLRKTAHPASRGPVKGTMQRRHELEATQALSPCSRSKHRRSQRVTATARDQSMRWSCRRSSKVVQASDEEYSDQNVPVGTVVSRRVVSGIPEGMAEGAQGGGAQPGAGEPGMNPQQVCSPADCTRIRPP